MLQFDNIKRRNKSSDRRDMEMPIYNFHETQGFTSGEYRGMEVTKGRYLTNLTLSLNINR